jgi:hypothetical protein
MGWRVTVKAGKVRDMKNKRRKTGKKRGWSGGSGPDNEPNVVPGSDPSPGPETAQPAAAVAANLAISAQSATVSPASLAPAGQTNYTYLIQEFMPLMEPTTSAAAAATAAPVPAQPAAETSSAPAVAQPAAAATPTVATAIAPTKPIEDSPLIAVPDPEPAIATVLSPVTASPLAAPSAAANPTSSNQPAIVKAAVTSDIAKLPKPPSFNTFFSSLYNKNPLNIVPNRTVPRHLYELVNADITNESYTNETFSCEINRIPITAQKSQTPQVFDCTILSKPNLIAQP